MATPIFSKQFRIKLDSSIIAMATDFSLDFTKNMIEIAYLSDAAYKSNIPDLKSWTVNFSGLQGLTSTGSASTIDYESIMFKMMNSDASVLVSIYPRPEDVSTQAYFEGGGYLSSCNQSGATGAAVTYSGTVVCATPLYRKTNT